MNYENVIDIKNKCYEIIRQHGNEEMLRVFKYYKGDLLPLINTKCRKNMTCGDLDCFQWDYQLKIFRFIECKRVGENNKSSQSKFLKFATTLKAPEYNYQVYKIIGDPPFKEALIIDFLNADKKIVNHEQLLSFLNMQTDFKDLPSDQGVVHPLHTGNGKP